MAGNRIRDRQDQHALVKDMQPWEAKVDDRQRKRPRSNTKENTADTDLSQAKTISNLPLDFPNWGQFPTPRSGFERNGIKRP